MTGATSRLECEREVDVLDAINARRWPSRVDAELREHATGCVICADVAAVALAMRDDCEAMWREARVPSAAQVWWRTQLRARQEAAAVAARPITVAQGLAAASTIGVGTAAIGYGLAAVSWPDLPGLLLGAATSLPGSVAEAFTGQGGVLAEHTPALALIAATALAALVLMPLAVYFALSEK